jgi:hypothetical protein
MMRRPATLLAALVFALSLAGCGGTTPPDGSLPCNEGIDVQRAAGFDPALEAQIPVAGWAERPTAVDSGRECSKARLGPLWGAGIRELRSAGAQFGDGGYSLVVYSAPGLTLDALAYAFERGARGGRKTQEIRTADETIAATGWPAFRMTLINGDHGQVVVLFADPAEAPLVRGLLTSDLSFDEVDRLLAAYAAALTR